MKVLHDVGGTMTEADLSEFQPEWVDPIQTTYRGWTVSQIPPQGQGIAVLMMLNLMERFPLGEYGFHSPQALHVMIEAKKLAYADLLRYIGDPRFSTLPVSELLARRARPIAPGGLIRRGHSAPSNPLSSTASRARRGTTRSI